MRTITYISRYISHSSFLQYRPLITMYGLEESSVAGDLHVSVDQDTISDVSSISGGEF